MTRNSTLRLSRITVACHHRGERSATEALLFAMRIGYAHGWTTAHRTELDCGCQVLFRTGQAARDHLAELQRAKRTLLAALEDRMAAAPGAGRVVH